VLWISGDHRLYEGVREVPNGSMSAIAVLHLGGVQFPVSGPIHYTMTASQAVELCGELKPRVTIPIHYEGWKHFRQGRDAIEAEFGRGPAADPRQRPMAPDRRAGRDRVGLLWRSNFIAAR